MGRAATIDPFESEHAKGVAALCRALEWTAYGDEQIARRGCAAPGVTTMVALSSGDREIIGFAQVLSDGLVQAFLAQIGVLPAFRRRGIARQLIDQAFGASGAHRLNLLTDDATAFYQSFPHKEKAGFRIYPTPP